MTIPIRNPDDDVLRKVNTTASTVYSQQRAMGSGRPRPIPVKTGATPPSDADYTAQTMPPIGTNVWFPNTNRMYVRAAVGSWLSVLYA